MAIRPHVAQPIPQPKRLSGGKLFLVIVVAIVAAIIVVGVLFVAFIGLTVNQLQQSYQARLSVNQVEWRYESPSFNIHSSRGHYYLWLNVSVANSGTQSITVSSSVFEIGWSGESAGERGISAWSSFDLAPGRSASLDVAFSSEGLKTPERLDFQYSYFEGGHIRASVSAPSGPASEVTFETRSAAWKDVDTYGLPASDNNRFLWLTFTMRNEWDKPASINTFYFKAEGQDGSTYATPQRQGPDEVSRGGIGTVTLVFEVPSTWLPKVLHYDMFFGPWADMGIPTPTGP